jgi:hypothetical protein
MCAWLNLFSPEIIEELDRRMEYFRQHPGDFATWDTVEQRILNSSS